MFPAGAPGAPGGPARRFRGADRRSIVSTAASAPAATRTTSPEVVTLDLPLRLLVWTTRTAVFALVVVGLTGIALGALAITHRA